MKNKKFIVTDEIVQYVLSAQFPKCHIIDKRKKEIVLQRIKYNMTYTAIAKKIQRSPPQVKNIFERSIFMINLYLKEKTPCMLIDESLLSSRIKRCLAMDENIKTIKDLNGISYDYLLKKRNLGHESIKEINEYIKDLGFSIKMPSEHKIGWNGKFSVKYFEDKTDDEILCLISSLIQYVRTR